MWLHYIHVCIYIYIYIEREREIERSRERCQVFIYIYIYIHILVCDMWLVVVTRDCSWPAQVMPEKTEIVSLRQLLLWDTRFVHDAIWSLLYIHIFPRPWSLFYFRPPFYIYIYIYIYVYDIGRPEADYYGVSAVSLVVALWLKYVRRCTPPLK